MNEMQMTGVILGLKKFKGTVEGRDIDKTTLFVQLNLDDSTGNGKGFTGSPIEFGKSDEFDHLSSFTYPLKAEMKIKIVTNGTKQKQVCTGVKPIHAPQQPAQGKAAS